MCTSRVTVRNIIALPHLGQAGGTGSSRRREKPGDIDISLPIANIARSESAGTRRMERPSATTRASSVNFPEVTIKPPTARSVLIAR